MLKKNRALIVTIIALILLIVFFAGYSFAKYYTYKDFNYQSSVAAWKFDVTTTSNIESGRISLKNTAGDINVADGKIAPGAKGSFDLIINATGTEVDTEYYVQVIDEDNYKPENLIFSVSKNDVKSTRTYSSLSQLAAIEMHDVIGKDEAKTVTYKIDWEWPYESGNDERDTTLANGTDLNYSFSLKVVGSQAQKGTKEIVQNQVQNLINALN